MSNKNPIHMKSFIATGLALLILCTSGQMVSAQTSPQDELAITDAQIMIMRKRNELQTELQRYAGGSSISIPQVLAVIGLEGNMVARLQQQSGAVANYREGESINANMKVASITPRQVTVVVGKGKKSRAVALDFAAGAVVNSGMTGMQGAPGMQNPGANGRVVPELLPDPPFVGVPPLPKELMSSQNSRVPVSTIPPAPAEIANAPVAPAVTASPVAVK
jgi:hypothetical protein